VSSGSINLHLISDKSAYLGIFATTGIFVCVADAYIGGVRIKGDQ